MLFELDWTVAASVLFMGVLAAGLGVIVPVMHRPWWHAQRRVDPRSMVSPVAPQVGRVEAHEADASVQPKVVRTADRRGKLQMPFIGKDRRQSGRGHVHTRHHDGRKHGTGS